MAANHLKKGCRTKGETGRKDSDKLIRCMMESNQSIQVEKKLKKSDILAFGWNFPKEKPGFFSNLLDQGCDGIDLFIIKRKRLKTKKKKNIHQMNEAEESGNFLTKSVKKIQRFEICSQNLFKNFLTLKIPYLRYHSTSWIRTKRKEGRRVELRKFEFDSAIDVLLS